MRVDWADIEDAMVIVPVTILAGTPEKLDACMLPATADANPAIVVAAPALSPTKVKTICKSLQKDCYPSSQTISVV